MQREGNFIMRRSTDVPASLAGYYYQLLLGGRELLYLLNDAQVSDNDGIGIEQGSDIRIFRDEGVYMEAKFYKDKQFTKNHQTIRHTICNFYHHFQKCLNEQKQPGHYQYVTNVPISSIDEVFFQQWPRDKTQHQIFYDHFILKSIVSESIVKEEPYKQAYLKFKATMGEGKSEEEYRKKLYESIDQDPSLFGRYCNRLNEGDMEQFIQSLDFRFATMYRTKLETVQAIKYEARVLLRSAFPDEAFEDDTCDHIFCCILDALFITTLNKDESYIEIKQIRAIVASHAAYQIRFVDEARMKDAIGAVEEETDRLVDFLNHDYKGTKEAEILHSFHELTEKLFTTMEEQGRSLEELIQSYTFNKKGLSINQVTRLLRPMSILAVFMNREPHNLKLMDPESIINFRLSENEPFILKDVGDSISNRQIITEFIKQTLNHTKDLNFDVQVIFGSSLQPCQIRKEFIDELVIDIGEVSQNVELHELYRNLTYKCTKCLHPGGTDECMNDNVCNFISGVCT